MNLTKFCQCGTEGELKQFATFSYYFCPQCKDEITESKPPTEVFSSATREPKFAGEMTFEEWSHALQDMFSSSDFVIYDGSYLAFSNIGEKVYSTADSYYPKCFKVPSHLLFEDVFNHLDSRYIKKHGLYLYNAWRIA